MTRAVPTSRSAAMPATHRVHNPYAPLGESEPQPGTRWLKGNIHVHTCEALDESISMDRIHGEDHDEVIRRSQAAPFNFDFVCTSVHPYLNNIELFSRGEQRDDFVVIPGREIQNDTIDDGGYLDGYFAGEHSKYLHVLSMGKVGGLSICAHPNFFETTRPRGGGEWTQIKKTLLNPCARLAEMNIMGMEVYNGLSILEEHMGARPYAPHMAEPCWDDLLCEGVRCAGFAGNDEFYREQYIYENYAPLGFIMVEAALTEVDILRNVKRNRFYASTGVMLADTPLDMSEQDGRYTFRVSALGKVKWKAMIQRDMDSAGPSEPDAPQLIEITAPTAAAEWELELDGDWKYVRFQAESLDNSLHRAWLQPIYGPGWVDDKAP